MRFQFAETAGVHVFDMSAMALVMFFVFAIIFAGYLLGKISIKGVSLGTAAIFLAALFAGHLKGMAFGEGQHVGISSWIPDLAAVNFYFKLIQTLGLILFVTSVGLIAGPSFFKNLRKNAKSYVLLGTAIILSGAAVCALVTLLVPGMDSAMSVGLLTGALTSTPAFAAAREAVGEASAHYGHVAVGLAVAYPFGVMGVVLFVQIIPRLLHADMAEERLKMSTLSMKGDSESGEAVSETAEGRPRKPLFTTDKYGLGVFALAVMLGLVLGAVHIPLGGGSSFSLGNTGGPLLAGLILGHLGRIRRFSLKVKEELLHLFQEYGLVLFLVGAGVDGGTGFVETLKAYGPLLFLWGALMTLIPLLVGFVIAHKLLKLSLLDALGAITGGMTSTPALGALINSAGTADVAAAYASTYPIALVLVVLLAQFLTHL